VKNPVGDGEHEIARFALERKGLVYKEKWADYLDDSEDQDQQELTEDQDDSSNQTGQGGQIEPDTGRPADIPALRTYDVYAGPGDTYDIIGQVVEESYQVMGRENGWQQIQFNGAQGWIRAVLKP